MCTHTYILCTVMFYVIRKDNEKEEKNSIFLLPSDLVSFSIHLYFKCHIFLLYFIYIFIYIFAIQKANWGTSQEAQRLRLTLLLQGMQAWSLVRELRSHMQHGTAKKERTGGRKGGKVEKNGRRTRWYIRNTFLCWNFL